MYFFYFVGAYLTTIGIRGRRYFGEGAASSRGPVGQQGGFTSKNFEGEFPNNCISLKLPMRMFAMDGCSSSKGGYAFPAFNMSMEARFILA